MRRTSMVGVGRAFFFLPRIWVEDGGMLPLVRGRARRWRQSAQIVVRGVDMMVTTAALRCQYYGRTEIETLEWFNGAYVDYILKASQQEIYSPVSPSLHPLSNVSPNPILVRFETSLYHDAVKSCFNMRTLSNTVLIRHGSESKSS